MSDISPVVESIAVHAFYIIGSISLVANSSTLLIIFWKRAMLDREIRKITVILQMTCLTQNLFFTMLFIPLLYIRAGAGYCLGILCGSVPYQILLVIFVFLSMLMFSAFGIIVIARQQLLVFDGSALKMSTRVRRVVYFLIFLFFQSVTVGCFFSTLSDRQGQIQVLESHYPQLKWIDRGLNWYLFNGAQSPTVLDVISYGVFLLVPAGCFLAFAPFLHMLLIVRRAGRQIRGKSQQLDKVHMRHAQTVIIQFSVLLLFLALPVFVCIAIALRDSVYADTQTLMVIIECVFACSSLANAYVVITRNRRYLEALKSIFHRVRNGETLPSASNSSRLFARRNG